MNIAKEKKDVDINFTKEAIKIIIKHLQLAEYIKNIEHLRNSKVLGRYNLHDNTIYIEYQKINQSLNKLYLFY